MDNSLVRENLFVSEGSVLIENVYPWQHVDLYAIDMSTKVDVVDHKPEFVYASSVVVVCSMDGAPNMRAVDFEEVFIL